MTSEKKDMGATEKKIREDISKILISLTHFEESKANPIDRYLIDAIKDISQGLNEGEKQKLEKANYMRQAKQRKAFLEASLTVKELVSMTGLSDRGVRNMIRPLLKIEHNNTYYVPQFQFQFDKTSYVSQELKQCLESFPPEISPIGKFNYLTKDNSRLNSIPLEALKKGHLDEVLADIRGIIT